MNFSVIIVRIICNLAIKSKIKIFMLVVFQSFSKESTILHYSINSNHLNYWKVLKKIPYKEKDEHLTLYIFILLIFFFFIYIYI